MLIAELPDHLTSLGGEDHKGLIISLFTAYGRFIPFSGTYRQDRRVPVMAFACWFYFAFAVFFLSVSYHSLSFLITSLLSSRFFHWFQNQPNGGLHC
jgi:hypothetical protein